MNSTREINAFRPSSSTIQKNSNLIMKPTAMPISTTSSTVISDSISSASHSQPVIIHAHSPKVLHIQACDFMAIVQKFTGFSSPSNDDNHTNITCKDDDPPVVNKKRKISGGRRKEKLVESSLNDDRQLKPQQWPSVTPIANVGFNPFYNGMWFGHGFTSEIFELPNSIYNFAEMPENSSISNINCSSSTQYDV